MRKTVIQHIASLIVARKNCERTGSEWFAKHEERLYSLARDFLPSGSGIDIGTTIDLDKSTGDKIVFHISFHHMNDAGMYDGWTKHTIAVTPAFSGFDIVVGGRNRNDIKDYLVDTFHQALSETLDESIEGFSRAHDSLALPFPLRGVGGAS